MHWATLKFDRISSVPTEGVQKWPRNEKIYKFPKYRNFVLLTMVIKSCCKLVYL